jgi:hypothetical protein
MYKTLEELDREVEVQRRKTKGKQKMQRGQRAYAFKKGLPVAAKIVESRLIPAHCETGMVGNGTVFVEKDGLITRVFWGKAKVLVIKTRWNILEYSCRGEEWEDRLLQWARSLNLQAAAKRTEKARLEAIENAIDRKMKACGHTGVCDCR